MLKYGYSLGAGLQFDGVDDFVNIPNNALINFEYTQPFSISYIIRPLTLNPTFGNVAVSKVNNVNQIGYFTNIRLNGLGFTFGFSTGVGVFRRKLFTTTSLTNAVNHITVTNLDGNPNNIRGYLNGVEITNFTVETNTVSSIVDTNPLFLGTFVNTLANYTNQILYDVKIFNKEITAQEALFLFQKRNVVIPATATSNVVANWRFNQKTGTTLIDDSGNALNGTLTNFTNTTPSAGNAWVDSEGNSIIA